MKIKTVLVVGGTSGIGLGIAEELISKGISVYIIGRRAFSDKRGFLNKIEFIQADLTQPNSLNYVNEQLKDVKLDSIIYSGATEAPLKNFNTISEEEFDYAFILNLKVPFILTQMLLPKLNLKARLLFLTSRLSSSPEEGSLIYCMTKSALEIFSLGLNKELADTAISSSIIPGLVDTEMQKRLREADPKIFPNTFHYQEIQNRLLKVKKVSELIVSHLCETDDEAYKKQRVIASEIKPSSCVLI